jgi:hypothetical protein
MRKITAKEFLAMIERNPSGFEHWNTPLEITEYIDCRESPITHLSPHLTFSGKNGNGDAADFAFCKSLQIATGTFHGFVWFSDSGIQKIENLHVTKNDNSGWASCFENCPDLEVATGTYSGYVSFYESGIYSINKLHIEKPNTAGNFTNVSLCPNLKTLGDWDLSKKIVIEAEKLAALRAQRNLKNFVKENKPKELPFL